MTFKRKHTGDVLTEMSERIQTGIDRMRNDFGRLNLEVDVLKGYALTPRQKAEVLGVMYFERSLVNPTQLSIVKRELTESKNFKEDNAWSLYNNVTEALKKSHPIDMINDHIMVHDFMKELTGMKADPVGIPAEVKAEMPISHGQVIEAQAEAESKAEKDASTPCVIRKLDRNYSTN
jgi:hypothetical protein